MLGHYDKVWAHLNPTASLLHRILPAVADSERSRIWDGLAKGEVVLKSRCVVWAIMILSNAT